jgi:hypothetical protein
MSTSGLEVFDTTLQKTQLWLKAIVTELEALTRPESVFFCTQRHRAGHAKS